MATEPSKHVVSLLLLTLVFTSFMGGSSGENPTNSDQYPTWDIHSLLPKYGFPEGLIPNVPNRYTLSSEGELEVELNTTCYVDLFHAYGDIFHYEKKITGNLSNRSLTDLSGITVKKLFLWLPITDIFVFGSNVKYLEFRIGIISEMAALEEFEKVKNCTKISLKGSLINSL